MAGESLRITEGKATGTDIELAEEFVIGRATTDEGKLGNDPELSRRHARISRRAGDQLVIEDLGSTNGTLVNGRRIDAPQSLKPGDTVKVGTTTMQVLDASGGAPQATRLGGVIEPEKQSTAAGPAAAAAPTPPPTEKAPPQAPPPRQPAAAPPPAAPPPPGAPPPAAPGRKGPPVPVIAAVAGLVVVAILAFVLLSGGGDDEPETLSSRDIVTANGKSTVSINTKGPGLDENGNKIVATGGGTGIVVDAQKGYVLTNDHVVAGATSVKARLDNGEEVNARVRGNAPCEDLAVIELTPQPRGLQAAKLGRSAQLAAGDKVTALGFPGAFEEDITQRKLQSTEGSVSSKPGPATLGANLPKLPSVIQHQAPISPGNSGGPLFNDTGEVIGINTLAAGGNSQNQNGAIAIDRAKSLLKGLEAGEDTGYVGWNIQNIADLNNKLYVVSVDSNSPADRANLVFGDRVDELDGTAVQDVPDVCDILGSKSAGDRMKVGGIVLDGRTYTTTVRLR